MTLRTADLPKATFALDGWNNPLPIQAQFASRAEIELCRAIIAAQVDLFEEPLGNLAARIRGNPDQAALVACLETRPRFALEVTRIPAPERWRMPVATPPL